MQIVKPYAMIKLPRTLTSCDAGIGMLRDIEDIARTSHRSEDLTTETSWERFIRNVVLDRGDWSVTEHVHVTVEFLVDRGITHELVRHRIGAYTQESTRFVNYEKKMPPSFVSPLTNAPRPVGNMDAWWRAIQGCEDSYRELIGAGIAPEIARSVFPNALASKIIATYNLRGWRHFFLMRSSKEAHPQMREVVVPLLAEFQRLIPLLYSDIVPESRQIDNMRKAR